MEKHYLLENSPEYYGNYVAKESFESTTAICFGEDPVKVHEEAKATGVEKPVVFYVCHPGQAHLY